MLSIRTDVNVRYCGDAMCAEVMMQIHLQKSIFLRYEQFTFNLFYQVIKQISGNWEI